MIRFLAQILPLSRLFQKRYAEIKFQLNWGGSRSNLKIGSTKKFEQTNIP